MDTQVKASQEARILKPDHEAFKPGEVGAILELIVKKKDGSTRERRVLKSKSYVRQFLELLLLQMRQVPEVAPATTKDAGGADRELAFSGVTFACEAAIGDDSYGIVIGTGTTAPTIDDHGLEGQIAHGTGAGQLQYGDVAFGLPTSDPTTSHFTVTRDFANASGGAITVNEIGLYVKALQASLGNYTNRGNPYSVMTIRDVITGGIDVPDGETLTVNYRQQATV